MRSARIPGLPVAGWLRPAAAWLKRRVNAVTRGWDHPTTDRELRAQVSQGAERVACGGCIETSIMVPLENGIVLSYYQPNNTTQRTEPRPRRPLERPPASPSCHSHCPRLCHPLPPALATIPSSLSRTCTSLRLHVRHLRPARPHTTHTPLILMDHKL